MPLPQVARACCVVGLCVSSLILHGMVSAGLKSKGHIAC